MKLSQHHIEALVSEVTQRVFRLLGSNDPTAHLARQLRQFSAEFATLADETEVLAHEEGAYGQNRVNVL